MPTEQLTQIGFRRVGAWQNATGPNQHIVFFGDTLSADRLPGQDILLAFCCQETVLYLQRVSTERDLMQFALDPLEDGENGRVRAKIVQRLAAQENPANAVVDILVFSPKACLQWGAFPLNIAAGLEDALIEAFSPPWNIREQEVEQVAPENTTLVAQCMAYIITSINVAQHQGLSFLDITSRDVHHALGWRNRFPTCCNALRALFRPGDRIMQLPNDLLINTSAIDFDGQRAGQPFLSNTLCVRFLTATERLGA